MTDKLEKPMIFIINFGGNRNGPSIPELDAFAKTAGAGVWNYIGANFIPENPNALQVRHSLQVTFDEIMKYAETGRATMERDNE